MLNNGGLKLRWRFSTGIALMNFFSDVTATHFVIKIICLMLYQWNLFVLKASSLKFTRQHLWLVLKLPFQFCSEFVVETCVPTNFASCFLLLLELCFDLGDLVFGECLTACSWLIVIFLLEGSSGVILLFEGSSGGASGHGVRFDGMVISNGWSIIHL